MKKGQKKKQGIRNIQKEATDGDFQGMKKASDATVE